MRETVALVADSTGYGGAEFYLATLVSQLRAKWRFIAFVGDNAAEETRRRLAEAGAEVREVKGLQRIPSPAAVVRLAAALRTASPALVHVNLTDQGGGLGALLATRLERRPVVATLNLVIPRRHAWRERVSKWALRLPGMVIGVSESVGRYAEEMGARTTVVRYGIQEPSLATDPRSALGLASDAFVIGGIGRVHSQKGWDVLCSAASLVREELPDAQFVVVGDGPELDELARESKVPVRFVGYHEQASALVRAFDMLVVPSRYEAFGFVALEAMYAGVPVIASEVGGLPEVVGDCGVLVPPERPELLARAILELATDPDRRATYAHHAMSRAHSLFTAERMAAETARVYETLAWSPRSRTHLLQPLRKSSG